MPRLALGPFSTIYSLPCKQTIWAATWQNQQKGCVRNEDSDQPGHPPSLIRVFAVRMKKAWVLSYLLSAQRRLMRLGGCQGWSESSLGAHSFCWFCRVVAHFVLLFYRFIGSLRLTSRFIIKCLFSNTKINFKISRLRLCNIKNYFILQIISKFDFVVPKKSGWLFFYDFVLSKIRFCDITKLSYHKPRFWDIIKSCLWYQKSSSCLTTMLFSWGNITKSIFYVTNSFLFCDITRLNLLCDITKSTLWYQTRILIL